MPFEVVTSPPDQAQTPESWSFRTLFGRERDKADRLPATGREKLIALRAARDDARAVQSVPYDKMKGLRDLADQVELRIAQLTQTGSSTLKSDHPLVVAEQASLDRFRSEMRELSVEHERRTAASSALETLVKHLEDYVAALPQTGVAAAPAIAPKAMKGETPADAVIRLRAAIDEADNQLFDALHAPIKSDAAKAIMRRHIEGLAERGRPNVLATIEGRQPPVFAQMQGPTIIVRGSGGASTGESPDVFDAEASFAWLHKDALIAAMEKAIDEDADDTDALDDATRAKRIAAAKAARLAAEREEEFYIVEAAQTGLAIQRRQTADPRAILGLSDSAPAPRDD